LSSRNHSAYQKRKKERGRYRIGEGIVGKVVKTGRSVIVPNINDEPLFLNRTRSRKSETKEGLCFICIPIRAGSEIIGTISADRRLDGPEEVSDALQHHVDQLSIIAAMISQAVRLKQLAHEIDRGGQLPPPPPVINAEADDEESIPDEQRPKNIIGNTKPMISLFKLIDKIAGTSATALVLGESGVGKELVASAIHFKSRRADKPFIKFNCAALPESIVESELFGHEKGSFTGAVATRQGRFELAAGGTIFLDEIGETPLETQVKLLRVLESGEFMRVGDSKTLYSDVRVIAATNKDLGDWVNKGEFRQDLYYRLKTVTINVPALRQRIEDLSFLVERFALEFTRNNDIAYRGIYCLKRSD